MNENILIAAHQNHNLIIFDDTRPLELNNEIIYNGTVELKTYFIKAIQLNGVLIHNIDMDDYTGRSCHRGAFPITSVVSRILFDSRSSIETIASMRSSIRTIINSTKEEKTMFRYLNKRFGGR